MLKKYTRLQLLQIALLAVGAVCGWGVWYYGDRSDYGGGNPGASGAAAGCGMIAAACIIGIVWIELSRTKNQEKL